MLSPAAPSGTGPDAPNAIAAARLRDLAGGSGEAHAAHSNATRIAA
jgi:hypothetical protein